jgi:hypothetical protein
MINATDRSIEKGKQKVYRSPCCTEILKCNWAHMIIHPALAAGNLCSVLGSSSAPWDLLISDFASIIWAVGS